MQTALEYIHQNYAQCKKGNSSHEECRTLAIVGNQGSIEREVNLRLQLHNGFDSEERLDGLHMEVADFHAGMKFSQVDK